jgi:hypothetical protein
MVSVQYIICVKMNHHQNSIKCNYITSCQNVTLCNLIDIYQLLEGLLASLVMVPAL